MDINDHVTWTSTDRWIINKNIYPVTYTKTFLEMVFFPMDQALRFPVFILKHLRAAKDRSIIQVGEKGQINNNKTSKQK